MIVIDTYLQYMTCIQLLDCSCCVAKIHTKAVRDITGFISITKLNAVMIDEEKRRRE